jgi:O-antigen/teichoic acid export membrane protein
MNKPTTLAALLLAFRQKLKSPETRPLLFQSGGSMLIQIASIGVIVVSNMLLTWWLGDTVFARYSFIISWVQLLTNIGLFGLQDYVLKELGVLARSEEKRPLAVSLVRQILGNSLLSASILAVAITAISFLIGTGQLHENRWAMLMGAPTIVLFAYIFQVQAIVRAWRSAIWSLLSEKIVRPLIISAVAAVFLLRHHQPTVAEAIGWITGCTVGAVLFSTLILFYKTDLKLADFWQKPLSYFPIDRSEQFNFLLLSIIGISYIRIDALFLGELGYINDVGVYNVATRFTDLVGFGMQTLSFVLTATYALYYKNNEIDKLQKLVTQSSRAIFGITIPLFLLIIVFGKFFLGVHSEGFTRGYPVILVLGSVQLISAFCGDNNAILAMCGFGRQAFWCLLAGFSVSVVLELLLIPPFGMLGAVVGRGIGSVIMYSSCAVMLWYKTGIRPTLLG